MHACFHGGGGGAAGVRSIAIIRDLAKNMKAMSLKVRAGGGGRGGFSAARRRRRRGRRAEAEEDPQLQQDKEVAAASASTSAKIAPAQPQEADGDRGTPPGSSNDHRPHEAAREEEKGHGLCEKCRSHLDGGAEAAAGGVAAGHTKAEESDGEWEAEPEPGVLMTLVSRPDGTNALRKIRFREELFDGARAAQRWWADNYDYIVELYSLVQSDRSNEDGGDEEEEEDSAPVTPCPSEDDDHRRRQGCESGSTFSGPSSGSGSGSGSGGGSASTLGSPILGLVVSTPSSITRERSPPPGPAQQDK